MKCEEAVKIAQETVTKCSWVPYGWNHVNIHMDGTRICFERKYDDPWPRTDPFCFKYGGTGENDYWVIHRSWLVDGGYLPMGYRREDFIKH